MWGRLDNAHRVGSRKSVLKTFLKGGLDAFSLIFFLPRLISPLLSSALQLSPPKSGASHERSWRRSSWQAILDNAPARCAVPPQCGHLPDDNDVQPAWPVGSKDQCLSNVGGARWAGDQVHDP